jgi:hypothetical protein
MALGLERQITKEAGFPPARRLYFSSITDLRPCALQ